MADFSKPSQITGIKRAVHELVVAISAAQASQEMQKAMMGHVCRAMAARLVLEMGSRLHGERLAAGGVING